MKNKTTHFVILLLIMLGFLSYVFSINSNKLLVSIATYSLIAGVALYIGLDKKSIGLSKKYIKNGVILALPFMAIIFLVALVIFTLQPEIFKDARYQQDSESLFYSIFITLPLYTVLLEELAFRGVLLGSLLRVSSMKTTILLSSITFGLWHSFTASAVSLGTFSKDLTVPSIAVVIAIVVITSFAGWFFAWLRLKSNSLVAPILVHWSINATGIILAYFAWNV
jgi:uncharacterized protein